MTQSDISITPAVGKSDRVARVHSGSCELQVTCVIFGGDMSRSEDDENDEEERVGYLLKGVIGKLWPAEVNVTDIRVRVRRRGSIILVLELPQPLPVLLMQLAAQRSPKLLEAMPGMLCCQLGGGVERLDGCEDRHVTALAKAMQYPSQLVEALSDAQNREEVLRARLLQLHSELTMTSQLLAAEIQERKPTSRAGFLRGLDELIGPKGDERWDGEPWLALRSLTWKIKPSVSNGVDPTWDDAQRLEYVKRTSTAKLFQQQYRQQSIEDLVSRGWDAETARCYGVLSAQGPALAKALRERSSTIAPCIHALYNCIYQRGLGSGQAPLLYRHLRGTYSLCAVDEAWDTLETADHTGFRGLCSSGITVADCDPANFCEGGYKRRHQQDATIQYFLEDSDVVCFVSRPEDEIGAHSAVLTYTDQTGVFPPNTLFRLQEVKKPGSWEAPGGVFPRQRLLVVTATYLVPRLDADHPQQAKGSKLCGDRHTLCYGNRQAYIDGIDALIAKPLLTMQQEFDRDMSWTDWKGSQYSLRAEWAYVTGPAITKQDCTAGTRDADNDGVMPEQFLQRVNELIRDRRAAGVGGLMPDAYAFLTMDEVLAARLYSGPAYQPINEFLREVSKATGAFRDRLAQHPELTFTATVRHLCRAIRKLAAHCPSEEATGTLYRGCRGELGSSFYDSDNMGMICAVDMAFLSASKDKQTPISYMGPGANVLWRLHASTDSDAGFHRGADISMLSQHASENEVLFPPMTLLTVLEPGRLRGPSAEVETQAEMARFPTQVGVFRQTSEGKKVITEINVRPSFF